jgi:hypothetical protein
VVGPEAVSRALLHLANQMPIQSVLVRRDLVLRAGGFDPDLLYLEDWDLWLRCTAMMPFGTSDAVTSRFRVPASRSHARERALRHAPWRDRIRTKMSLGGSMVASDDMLRALDRLRDRPEDYIPAGRLMRALVRRLAAALRRGPA